MNVKVVKPTSVYRSLMGFSIKYSRMKAAVLHYMLIYSTHAPAGAHTDAHSM